MGKKCVAAYAYTASIVHSVKSHIVKHKDGKWDSSEEVVLSKEPCMLLRGGDTEVIPTGQVTRQPYSQKTGFQYEG